MSNSLDYEPIPGVTPSPGKAATLDQGKLDELVNTRIFSSGLAAGAVVAVVRAGQGVLRGAYSSSSADHAPVVWDTSLFRIGSMSKVLTATAVMRLKQEGKLSLDDDVNRYLDNFRIPPTFAEPIRIRNLLTHTTGFEDNQFAFMVKRFADDVESLEKTLALHMPARVRPPTTDFTDGRGASYSSWGMALAGLIVSKVSGLSFDDYMDRNIFARIGMRRSTFREPLPREWAADMVPGYDIVEAADGKKVLQPHGFEHFHGMAPSSGAISCAPDMQKFMIAHLPPAAQDSMRLLDEATLAEMQGRALGPHRHVSGAAMGFYEMHLNGRRILMHAGRSVCFSSNLCLFPDDDVGLFIAVNTPASVGRGFIKAFMDLFLPASDAKGDAPAVQGSARQCVGTYLGLTHSYEKTEKFGLLVERERFEVGVRASNATTLVITNISGPESQWNEVADGVFYEPKTQQTIAFQHSGSLSHIVGPMAFQPNYKLTRWLDLPALHEKLLGTALAAFAVAVGWWVADGLFDMSGKPREALGWAAAMAALDGYAIWALRKAFKDYRRLLYAFPSVVGIALTLILASIPITAIVGWFTVCAWAGGYWNLIGRVAYTTIAMLGACYLWSLNYWNLVGYKQWGLFGSSR